MEERICDCAVCRRIQMIKEGRNPYFVKELETGYVVLGDSQRFLGYSLFLCKEHAQELHVLEPDKLNYELLGVGNAVHMHWHLFPRRDGDTPNPGPVWRLSKEEMNGEQYRPTREELEERKQRLKEELEMLLAE